MKKPQIDLSKQGLQQFLLHHVEKLILVVAIALTGFFFWMGFSTSSYDEKTPPEMSELASRANNYIVKAGWDELKEVPHRNGDDKADDRIRNMKLVELDQYELGRFSGVAAKTRGLRPDPDMIDAVPRELEIHVFRAPVLGSKEPEKREFVSSLPDARTGNTPEESKGSGRDSGRGGGGLGAGGAGFGPDEPGKDDDEETLYGDVVPDAQRIEMGGVRPTVAKVPSAVTRSVVTNIVAVNGIIDHKKLYETFQESFDNAVGYFPPRDKPNYLYVQIQRQGKDGTWKDIGNKTYELLNKEFPTTGPEIVNPRYYDDVITGYIPPITQFDYRPFATHSKVPMRIFESPEEEDEIENQASPGDEPDDGFNFGGSRDSRKAKDDKTKKKKKERGGARRGSDRTLYETAMQAIKPRADHKLFRFFDVGIAPGQYKYRVRVWLKDPNNEDPEQQAGAAPKKRRGGPDRGAGTGGEIDEGQQPGGNRGGGDPFGKDKEDDEDEALKKIAYTEIEDEMKEVAVRNRIDLEKLARKGDDPAPGTKIGSGDDEYEIANLKYGRPAEWLEFEVTVPKFTGTDFYAGPVKPGRQVKTSQGPVQVGDSTASLVTSVWDSRFDTRIPVHREVYRGDVLDFEIDEQQPVHLLHPVDWTVRRLDKHEVATNALVVDIMGGQTLPIRSEIPYKMPGEVLIMDANDEFRVQNNLNDATNYRHSLFKEDESNEFGKRKKPKKRKDGRDGGGGGGLGGGG